MRISSILLPLALLLASATSAQADTRVTTPVPPANFGSAPSGEIPILYNDHTVYTKPDILRRSRVLAAFIKNHQVYVPLRSMFEQMGATVTASADGKTFRATKTGTTISVRLGSSEVTINGESRPLDVPPILYHGVFLVPVRVISEALGAYVLWVSSRHVVVVRYLAAVPPPAPEASSAPLPAGTPIPVPTVAPPAPHLYNGFVAVAKSRSRNYNEFSAGQFCPYDTLVASAAYMFKKSPFAIKGDYREDGFVSSINAQNAFGAYFTQFSTIDGGTALTPVFLGKQSTIDGRLEYKLADPNVYVGLGYLQTSTNYGYPHLNAIGAGIEKLPSLNSRLTTFGSLFYYPRASGNYTVSNPASVNNGTTYKQVYAITKYDLGAALTLSKNLPIYVYGGFSGDRYSKRQNAPIDQTHGGPYLGLGLKI